MTELPAAPPTTVYLAGAAGDSVIASRSPVCGDDTIRTCRATERMPYLRYDPDAASWTKHVTRTHEAEQRVRSHGRGRSAGRVVAGAERDAASVDLRRGTTAKLAAIPDRAAAHAGGGRELGGVAAGLTPGVAARPADIHDSACRAADRTWGLVGQRR